MDVYIFERGGEWLCGPIGDSRRFPSRSAAHAYGRDLLRANAPGRLISEEPRDPEPPDLGAPPPAPATPASVAAEEPAKRWTRLAGPPELGRSIILPSGSDVPSPWTGCERINTAELDAESMLREARRRYLARTATVYLAPEAPSGPRADPVPSDVWAVPVGFEFPTLTAWELIESNSVDARDPDSPIWPWTMRAIEAGRTESDRADVALGDGTHAFIDGGPFRVWDADEFDVRAIPAVALGTTIAPGSSAGPAAVGLAADQLAAVREAGGTARIIAPAGSGKTRVLTERARYLISECGVSPAQLTLVAYNKRAQIEIQERTADLPGLQVQTLNALALAIVNGDRGFAARPQRVATIIETQVRDLLGEMISFPRRANTDPAASWLDALSFVRLGLRDPEEVEAEFSGDVAGFAEYFPQYRAELSRRGVVDFDEQIYLAIETLLSEPLVRQRAQQRCQMMLVDEFQDLTPAHLLLIGLVSGARRQVFGVGDDDQTIYGYTGASPHWLVNYDEYFPGAVHHALEVNYRCPETVVDAAKNLLSHNRSRVNKDIGVGADNSRDADALQAQSTGDPVEATTREVQRLIDAGAAPADIAVLSRVNVLLVPVRVALSELGIPTRSRESSARFLSRSGVEAALSWIELATATGGLNGRSVRAAARRPSRAISPMILGWMTEHNSLSDLRSLADRLREERDQKKLNGFLDDVEMLQERGRDSSTAELIEVIRTELAESGLDGSLSTLDDAHRGRNTAAHSDDLRALASLARMHPDPADFGRWLGQAVQTDDSVDGGELSTVHRVKGLEWPHIIVHDATDGVFPHRLSEDIEEERRIFHVAITRSRQTCTIVADERSPTAFIEELRTRAADGDATQLPQPAHPTRPSGSGAKSRSASKSRSAEPEIDDPATQQLFDALRQWRSKTAKSKGVPAFVVARDRTLKQIANRLPDSRVALLDCHGIGPAKADEYGDDILEIVATSERPTSPGDPASPVPAPAPPPTEPTSSAPSEPIIEALREWRVQKAAEEQVPAFVILHDRTIEEIASVSPTTETELLQVGGIGPAKLENHGDEILAIVAEHSSS